MDILFKNDHFVFSYRVGGILKHNGMPIFLVMTGIVNDIYEIWYIVLGINICFAIGCLVKGLVSYKTKQFA